MNTDFSSEAVHTFFGLTYASYFVLPKKVVRAMNAEWRQRWEALMQQMQATYVFPPSDRYKVRLRKWEDEVYEDGERTTIYTYPEDPYKRTGYIVLPRLVMSAMPGEWQEEFVELVEAVPDVLGDLEDYEVLLRCEANPRETEHDWLSDYKYGRRHLERVEETANA